MYLLQQLVVHIDTQVFGCHSPKTSHSFVSAIHGESCVAADPKSVAETALLPIKESAAKTVLLPIQNRQRNLRRCRFLYRQQNLRCCRFRIGSGNLRRCRFLYRQPNLRCCRSRIGSGNLRRCRSRIGSEICVAAVPESAAEVCVAADFCFGSEVTLLSRPSIRLDAISRS